MKNKILRSMCGLILLTLVAAFAIFCDVIYRQNVEQVKSQLADETACIAAALGEVGEDRIEVLVAPVQGTDKRVTLIDSDGTVLYDTDSAAARMENHSERPEIRAAQKNGYGEAERYSDTIQKKNFYYALALEDGRILRLSITTDSAFATIKGQLYMAAVLACALFALSITVADRVSRRIVEPINRLDLREPLKNPVYDELSPLLLRLEKQNRQIDEQMEHLRAREAEFNAITEHMQEGLILLNSKLQVLSINGSAKKILGVRKEDFEKDPERTYIAGSGQTEGREEEPLREAGMPLHILNLNRSQELLTAVKAAQTGEAGHCTMEHEGRIYSLLASPVSEDEKNGGVVIFLLDVTEERNAERIRREFSANVSHELKTPLTSISGYAEIIENGLVKPEDIAPFAGRIHREALRLINLIEDIIKLSRLDENADDWQKEPVELKALCEEITARLSSQARSRRITMEVMGQNATVTGVRRLLDEMFTNLCDNAIKYNKDGGQVTVTVESGEKETCVTVSDTGIGISPEHQSRIFERFYRVDKSHSRETGGTGLGLSIVKHAAAIHGAQIRLESEEGRGTSIRISFPASSDGPLHY